MRLTNWIAGLISPAIFLMYEKKTQRMVEQYISNIKPDIVVSLIPFVNYPVSEACRTSNVPFLLVTTDNDLTNWCHSLKKRSYDNFKVTIGRDLPTSRTTLLRSRVPGEAIETIGLPLRPEFLNLKAKQELRFLYNIPRDRDVVLIMMGGMGARSTLKYVEVLANAPLNIHLLVCTGKNKKLAQQLKNIRLLEGNTIEIIPFTEKVHELFNLSDLIITKPGPGTINEAQALRIPVLVDQMGTPLFWEKVNIDLVQAQHIGAPVHSLEELPNLVRRFLRDEQTKETVERAYAELDPNKFSKKIKTVIEEMIGEPVAGEVLLTSRVTTPL